MKIPFTPRPRLTVRDPHTGIAVRTFGEVTLIYSSDEDAYLEEIVVEIPLDQSFKEELRRGELARYLTRRPSDDGR